MKYSKLNKKKKVDVIMFLSQEVMAGKDVSWHTEFAQHVVCLSIIKHNLARDRDFCVRLMNLVESDNAKSFLTKELSVCTVEAVKQILEEENFLPQEYESYIVDNIL